MGSMYLSNLGGPGGSRIPDVGAIQAIPGWFPLPRPFLGKSHLGHGSSPYAPPGLVSRPFTALILPGL
jgi:hypothetical protein